MATEIEVKDSTRDERVRAWEDLHESILFQIFQRLFAGDRNIFRLVCKSWNLKTLCKFKGNTSECPSPELMLPRNMFHPIYEEFSPVEFPDLPGAQLHVAKDDWFLCEKPGLKLFFYNPFTKEEIRLPNLFDVPSSMYISSTPKSTDWMVVVTRISNDEEEDNVIAVDTITCGEQEWTTDKYFQKEENYFELSSCNAVSYRGLFYFLGQQGRLMVHDSEAKEFYFYEAPESLSQQLNDVREKYLLEKDGEIIAVFVGNDGSWIHVCRWNLSNKEWEVLESLGNKALFVSRPLSVCETVSARGMGNRIYFTRLVDDHCVFYSLATKEFHTFNGYSSKTFHGAIRLYKPSTWIYPS